MLPHPHCVTQRRLLKHTPSCAPAISAICQCSLHQPWCNTSPGGVSHVDDCRRPRPSHSAVLRHRHRCWTNMQKNGALSPFSATWTRPLGLRHRFTGSSPPDRTPESQCRAKRHVWRRRRRAQGRAATGSHPDVGSAPCAPPIVPSRRGRLHHRRRALLTLDKNNLGCGKGGIR